MTRVVVVAIVAVVGLAATRTAAATGTCENLPTRYDAPELFDPTTQSFAINAVQDWCETTQDGDAFDEQRGDVAFVELRDLHDHVLGRLSTATGDDAKHLAGLVAGVDTVPVGKLHATLVKRGYAPVVTHSAAKHACTLAMTWGPAASGGGWVSAPLSLDVSLGGKPLLQLPLGDGTTARRGDQFIRAHYLTTSQTIAVFALLPSCAGPPPGYFGHDDGGNCYHVNTPLAVALDVKSHPELAACF